ncbi:MAG: hypothetical protein V3T90_07560 [Anaerolineae bacterium]
MPGITLEQRRQPLAVLDRLRLDAAQRLARGLGLYHADGPPIYEEHIVGKAGGERELPHSDATGRAQVDRVAGLDGPASGLELVVNLLSGFLLGLHRALPSMLAQ